MRTFWMALPAVVLAAGCAGGVGYGTYDTYGSADLYGDVYTDIAPPAPLVEVVPSRPAAGYAWTAGYWAWTGNQYVWRPGTWDRQPAGSVWVRHGWVQDRGRYRYVPGRWATPGRYRDVPYVHRTPGVRYGDRYAVIPYGRRAHPYARVPRTYQDPRYRDDYGRYYQGRVWGTPGSRSQYRRAVPPARAYVIP